MRLRGVKKRERNRERECVRREGGRELEDRERERERERECTLALAASE